jgi:ubiquinone/menaquinone biosynthesis C-methylase UbiE
MRASRQVDLIFRHYILDVLNSVGLFSFIQQKRSYGEILAEFDFVDNEYTRDVFKLVTMDRQNVIVSEDDVYYRKADVPLPELEQVLASTPSHLHSLTLVCEGLYENILDRMREKNLDVEEVFIRDEERLVTKFNTFLENPLYSAVRVGTFDFLPNHQRAWLEGKKLLEVGCGNGYETAEIWILGDGKIHITGVDLVSSMVDLARQNFRKYLLEMNSGDLHLDEANVPAFEQGSAMDLPYEADSFQAAYFVLMLHWVSDPRMALREMIRVVEPGGVIFGAQPYKPYISPFVDLIIRSSRNSNGFFWKEDFVQWFREFGLEVELTTPAGIFRVTNSEEASKIAIEEATSHGSKYQEAN